MATGSQRSGMQSNTNREQRGGKRKPAKLRFWDAHIVFTTQRDESHFKNSEKNQLFGQWALEYHESWNNLTRAQSFWNILASSMASCEPSVTLNSLRKEVLREEFHVFKNWILLFSLYGWWLLLEPKTSKIFDTTVNLFSMSIKK